MSPDGRRARTAIAIGLGVLSILVLAWLASRGEGGATLTDSRSDTSRPPERGPSGGPGTDAGASSEEVTADAGARAHAWRPVRLGAATARTIDGAGGSVAGHVVALGGGAGVAGARMTFVHGEEITELTTAADGSFVLAPEDLGTFRLAIVEADGFLPFAPAWGESPLRFEVRAGRAVEGVVITLVEAVTYVVEVVDAAGPVAGAEVIVHGVESGERALAPMVPSARTGRDGTASLVAPDDAVIEAREGARVGRAAIDSAAQVTRRVRVELGPPAPELAADASIEGYVVSGAGLPIEGATLTAIHVRSASSAVADLHPPLLATTDASGHFRVEGADAGRYHLEARHPAHATGRAVAAAGARDVEIVLEAGVGLRVHVVDGATDAPVVAATVVVERAVGPLVFERLALGASYDGEGVVEIDALPRGAARIVAAAPGYAPSAPLEVTLGAGTTEARVSLGRGGAIVGRVTSADGTPLARARVSLESRLEPGTSAAPLEASATTDASGSFALGGVPPGVRSVAAWAEGHHGRLRSGIAVTEGAPSDVGAIDLVPLEPGETPRLELAGIGVVLQAEGEVLSIGRVVEGGGASAAGLVPGDAIVAIEGEPVVGLGFEACIERLRGPEGTAVTVLVRHADGREEVVIVPRRRIRA